MTTAAEPLEAGTLPSACNPAMLVPVLEELRTVIDERERLAAEDKKLAARKADLEHWLLDYYAVAQTDVRGGGLSVSFDPDAVRASYEPEAWNDIVKWAAETGNLQIIQRRFTDAQVVALVKDGTPFPSGLSLSSYTKISVRRI